MTALDDSQLHGFIDAAYAFACSRTVAEVVDTERLLAALDTITTDQRPLNLLTRFVGPARGRLIERLLQSDKLLGAAVPDSLRDIIAEYLGRPAPIPQPVIDEVVHSERVREAVRAMLEESMKSVIDRAFKAAPGGRGLRGLVGLAGAAGRGIFGGIGEEVQRALEDRLRDTLDFGVGLVLKRLGQRLGSEDTAKSLGLRRRALFLEALKLKERRIGKALADVPWLLLDGIAPPLLQHNLQRPEVREAVRAEIAAAISELSTQTVGALLDELGLREWLRESLHAHGLPLVRAFLASPEYTGWQQSSSQ